MAKGVSLGVDGTAISSTSGYVKGFTDTVMSDKYISSVVGFVQSELSQAFGMALDIAAHNMPESFHHVYEWGNGYRDYSTVGDPTKRLWQLTQMGRGSDRVVGYIFKPSVKPVPIRPELAAIGVKEDLHVFTWKAPVMEYGMRVTVNRMPGTKVLVFTDNSSDEVRFEKGPFSFQAGVSPHGRPNQRRMFTSFFIAWWQKEGPELYHSKLKPQIESGMPKASRLGDIARKLRRRGKQFRIDTTMEGKKTFASARVQARKDLEGQARELRQKTAQRRLDKYGY